MGNAMPQTILNCAVMAVLLLAMLIPVLMPAPGKKRWQFNLRIFLLFVIPILAIGSWIISWEGPYFSPQRVVTPKFGTLILLVDFAGVVFFIRWIRAMAKAQRDAKTAAAQSDRSKVSRRRDATSTG